MTMRDYEAIFCDETPFTGRRYAYNRETERYEVRLFEGRLQVTPEKMFADIDSPNGIQVLWQHGSWFDFGPSMGRITEMAFKSKALVGMVSLSEPDVMQFVPGGLDAVEAGIMRGLSVGLNFLDNPPVKWEMGEGTREKPDKLTYEAVRVMEVSMTPVPRLYTAGLTMPIKRTDNADTGDEGLSAAASIEGIEADGEG